MLLNLYMFFIQLFIYHLIYKIYYNGSHGYSKEHAGKSEICSSDRDTEYNPDRSDTGGITEYHRSQYPAVKLLDSKYDASENKSINRIYT